MSVGNPSFIQTFCALSGLLNFLACLGFAFFLYARNPTGKINHLFSRWSFSVAFWSFGYFMWLITPTPSYDHALFWTRFLMAGAIVIPTTYLHFALCYLNLDTRHSHLISICYLFTGVYLLLDFTPLFINYLEPRYWFGLWPVPGILYHFYQAYFVTVVIYTHILLFRKAKTAPSAIVRKQFKIVALGTLLAYAGGSTNFFLWYNIPIPPVFNFLVTAYVALIGYAILHYRLWGLDFQIVLTRTSILIALCVVILGLPSSLAYWGKTWLMNGFGSLWWIIPFGVYTLLVAAAPFLFSAIQHKAEERLVGRQRQYQQTLLQASRGMTLIKDLEHLLALIVHMLTRTIGAIHASVFLFNEKERLYERRAMRGKGFCGDIDKMNHESVLVRHLSTTRTPTVLEEIRLRAATSSEEVLTEIENVIEALRAAVVVPSFIREKLIGFLILGEKRSMDSYSQDDLNTLATLANQAALAFENCEFITEVERTQLQLFQAAKMADLGTMASGIGHQINNRLNVIKLGTDSVTWAVLPLLRQAIQSGNPGEAREVVDRIEVSLKRASESAKQGGEIVRHLLDFSKLSVGFQEVSLPEALEKCIRLWECKKDLSLIWFENKIPKDLPLLWANFTQVEEVLFNLLDNAYDAIDMKKEEWEFDRSPKPENPEMGRVTISAQPVEREGKAYVEICVEDTGIGMSPETQQQIFVPFFTTKATSIKGTGLGLFVMKRMVQANKGEIAVESEYGKGSTFRVLFPATKENQ